MIAEILVTGQEILTGAVIDSNSAHIAHKLETVGLDVLRRNLQGEEAEDTVNNKSFSASSTGRGAL